MAKSVELDVAPEGFMVTVADIRLAGTKTTVTKFARYEEASAFAWRHVPKRGPTAFLLNLTKLTAAQRTAHEERCTRAAAL